MASAAVLTSASGILSLLEEPDVELKVHALEQLNKVVDHFWSEIASSIPQIEELYEDEDFGQRKLAAVVASKVFYHLEELDDALKYALGAGSLFDIEQSSEYVETLISKCIDEYIRLRVSVMSGKGEEEKMDERLEAVVERMFERCFTDGQYKQALGVALEARRMDMIRKSIVTSSDVPAMLEYCFEVCHTVVNNRDFRQQVLRVLVELYKGLDEPDYISMCQCLLFLDDHTAVAAVLDSLLQNDPLMAYQVAFDLSENQNQPFLLRVVEALPVLEAPQPTATATTETEPSTSTSTSSSTSTTTTTSTSTSTEEKKEEEEEEDTYASRMKKLKNILDGSTPINLYLHFLYGHNKTDLTILNQIKEKLEARNPVTHNATVMAHAIMHVGTTVDVFLRTNLEWLGRAKNWAKFTATASIGVIHKGHHDQSLKLLQPYLPQEQVASDALAFQEGGALYALGLIHANCGDKTDYLLNALQNANSNEIIQHGACLGLGLTAMASANMAVVDEIKKVVYTENAVAGEAAGLALGLVLLGSGNGDVLQEMLQYASEETQHEKIIRGLSMGMAMVCYAREEEADTVIEQLIRDKNPILRAGAMYAIAMAYVATSNNGAIRKLLHIAVSDVNDDVRRAAVTALGFVLCAEPKQVPRIVSLLAESYNPHVRYGACLAVGIACAGTGMQEAVALLEPMCKDRVDFVRQGAFIALSMVLIQHNDKLDPHVKTLRTAIMDSVSSKGDTMTKFGAIVGAGILDAGGRNMTISLMSAAGHKKMAAIVGMAIFPQFWYWYPNIHFISLSFTPTAVIGLNKDLKMPKPFSFQSNAPPSMFAYPAPMEVKKEEKKKKVKKATLSVTAKAKAKKKSDAKMEEGGDEDVEMTDKTEDTKKKKEESEGAKKEGEEKKEGEATEDAKEKEKEKKEPEAAFEVLANPARVTWKQQTVMSYDKQQRYQPAKKVLCPGVVMLRDSSPDEAEDIVVQAPPKIGVPGISDDEPEPPKPFEFLR